MSPLPLLFFFRERLLYTSLRAVIFVLLTQLDKLFQERLACRVPRLLSPAV